MVGAQDGSSITGTANFTPKSGQTFSGFTITNELGETANTASASASIRCAGNVSVVANMGAAVSSYTASISKGTGIDYA